MLHFSTHKFNMAGKFPIVRHLDAQISKAFLPFYDVFCLWSEIFCRILKIIIPSISKQQNFLELNAILLVSCHWYSLSRSSWRASTSSKFLTGLSILVSLANMDTSLLMLLLMSLIMMRNKTGPDWNDFIPLAMMNCFLLDRKLWRHMPSYPLIPISLCLWQRILMSTLLKALAKSK